MEIEAEIDPFEADEIGVEYPEEEEDEEQKAMNDRFKALYKDIGDDIDYQTLHFVVPMKTRTAREVRSRIQQIYLQLRQQGLPLVRIHSDRGLELMAKESLTGISSQLPGRVNNLNRMVEPKPWCASSRIG